MPVPEVTIPVLCTTGKEQIHVWCNYKLITTCLTGDAVFHNGKHSLVTMVRRMQLAIDHPITQNDGISEDFSNANDVDL